MRQDESLAEQRYFHLHGLKSVAPETLNCALQEAINELEAALYGPSRTELTEAEIAMLERAGVDVDERPDATDPMLDYAIEFAAIRATSLTPVTVAERLGVTPVRIRQMIRDGNLYAMRIEGRLHLPSFQLTARALVPNIGRVNQEITDRDPVSAQRWLTTADPDLEDFTPRNWLKAGRDVDAVLHEVPES